MPNRFVRDCKIIKIGYFIGFNNRFWLSKFYVRSDFLFIINFLESIILQILWICDIFVLNSLEKSNTVQICYIKYDFHALEDTIFFFLHEKKVSFWDTLVLTHSSFLFWVFFTRGTLKKGKSRETLNRQPIQIENRIKECLFCIIHIRLTFFSIHF